MTEIQQIRAFNRTVTQRLGVLNEKYLGRDRPLAESRLLFEIGPEGAEVRELRARLGLDSGFLSRMLRTLEHRGLAATGHRSHGDGRVRFARLTRSGRAELRRLNALSDDLARSMLTSLSRDQARRLVAAMSEVERLLLASSVEIAPGAPSSSDARRCLDQYFAELARRFHGGYSRSLDRAAEVRDFVPPKGSLLIARQFGTPIGCGGIRTLERRVAEIKRMWIAPSARGLGIGRRLLRELEQFARRHGCRTIRLDTNESLREALQLYRSSGYREIERYNDNPYAHHWFEKRIGGL
jgi:GNAT superfamily N-acetyltransferase/DNA-binding MarR family transcriptional regulator